MKKLFLIVIFPVIAFFAGCKSDTAEDGVSFSANYIQVYLFPEEIKLSYDDATKRTIWGRFRGSGVDNIKQQKEKFDLLRDKYDDKTFNRKMPPGSNQVVESQIEYFQITCDRRFDDLHDAGESLNDIVWLETSSPYDFIRDGYKITDPSLPRTGIANGYIITEKLLTEITPDDLKLMHPEFLLTFTTSPAPGEYTFTVTVKIEDREIRQSVDIVFD